jgi:hypothetical protein
MKPGDRGRLRGSFTFPSASGFRVVLPQEFALLASIANRLIWERLWTGTRPGAIYCQPQLGAGRSPFIASFAKSFPYTDLHLRASSTKQPSAELAFENTQPSPYFIGNPLVHSGTATTIFQCFHRCIAKIGVVVGGPGALGYRDNSTVWRAGCRNDWRSALAASLIPCVSSPS